MSIRIALGGWGEMAAYRDDVKIAMWLSLVAKNSKAAFEEGMRSPKSGKFYRRKGGRIHRASAGGEYPAVDYGELIGSVKAVSFGTKKAFLAVNVPYARYLRKGTPRMAKRKMTKEALKEGRARTGPIGNWARWRSA